MTLEDALDQLYQGKENAAKLAAAAGISKAELQQVFRGYVEARPIDDDIWRKDVELSWPHIT